MTLKPGKRKDGVIKEKTKANDAKINRCKYLNIIRDHKRSLKEQKKELKTKIESAIRQIGKIGSIEQVAIEESI